MARDPSRNRPLRGRLSAGALALSLALAAVFLGRLEAGRQLPGNCNQDARLDISDAVCLLTLLFVGREDALPCGDGDPRHAANIALMDSNGDAKVDISDAVHLLAYLFAGGRAPALGAECVEIDGCPAAAACESDPPAWSEDIQPILVVKCKPCHTGEAPGACSGGSCLSSFYEDLLKPSLTCPDEPVFACSLERILDGSMPLGRDCTGDPFADSGKAGCFTLDELELFRAWVEAGAPE